MTRIISSASPVDVLTQSRRSKRRSEAHHSRLMCLLRWQHPMDYAACRVGVYAENWGNGIDLLYVAAGG
ncbi:hypothetical protein V2P20_00090 [Methylobacter sp. Wu1]|uniref:hypothetical protein n=1 Tax=Methylobacter sp. Wu1 TaxID=3119359 RepID=UPI002F94FE22